MAHPETKSQIHDEDGDPTGATFGVEKVRGTLSIRFDSRGTTEGTRAYRAGLILILERLADSGATVTDVCVETRTTGHLPRSERTVFKAAKGAAKLFRDALKTDGADAVRARIGSAAAKVGRPPDARGGGNGTKRLRLYLDTRRSPAALTKALEG